MIRERYYSIRQFLTAKGIRLKTDNLRKYQIVHVAFNNEKHQLDEVSFDVHSVGTKAGNAELSELYEDFCKENNFRTDTVVSVTVVASADTKEDLEQINR